MIDPERSDGNSAPSLGSQQAARRRKSFSTHTPAPNFCMFQLTEPSQGFIPITDGESEAQHLSPHTPQLTRCRGACPPVAPPSVQWLRSLKCSMSLTSAPDTPHTLGGVWEECCSRPTLGLCCQAVRAERLCAVHVCI